MLRIKYWMPMGLREWLFWMLVFVGIVGFAKASENAFSTWGTDTVSSIINGAVAIIFWNLHFVGFGYLKNNKNKENKNG